MRRFTLPTNGFSKKVENLAAAVSVHFVYYNFARPHQMLTKANGGRKTTPRWQQGRPTVSGPLRTSFGCSTPSFRPTAQIPRFPTDRYQARGSGSV
jgi:hypothetical protein